MSKLIAKRYVKALIDGKDVDTIVTIAKQLQAIASAYGNEKFVSIIASIDVSVHKKVALIVSFVDGCEEHVKNLISLLGKNRRLDILPHIAVQIAQELAVLTNNYSGVVYSNEKLSHEHIQEIAQKLAKRFDVTLCLENRVCDYDGIKVDIDSLGVEIGFSNERLKSQMIEHILKAV